MKRTHTTLSMGGAALAVAALVTGGVLAAAPTSTAEAAKGVGTPECTIANLAAKYKGGDAATSHVYGRIILRNVSDETCWVKGYGGLSYVGKGNGSQIGAAADRTPSPTPKVVLEPGVKVRSAVVETSTGPYSASQCRPTKVDGFRVYVPDETHGLFIAHATTGCANDAIHLLTHKAYH